MIQKSEIIKLGRMKFWVKEFATETEHFENDAKCEYYDVVTLNEVNHNLENFQCWFCWDTYDLEENPMLSPCIC